MGEIAKFGASLKAFKVKWKTEKSLIFSGKKVLILEKTTMLSIRNFQVHGFVCVQIKIPQRDQKSAHCFFVQSSCADYREILKDLLFIQH